MKTALVLGGAACIWADVEAALALGQYDKVVTCNDITSYWPGKIDGAVSLHSDSWGRWLHERERRGWARPDMVYGHLEARGSGKIRSGAVDQFTAYKFPGQNRTGSSGLFAVKVALYDLQCDRAVCCGIPLERGQAHFFDDKPWAGSHHHHRGWLEAKPEIKDRVRSMSGWTQELLGAPTADWVAGRDQVSGEA